MSVRPRYLVALVVFAFALTATVPSLASGL
jgi:hypothetical protein